MSEQYQDDGDDEWLPAGIAPHKYGRSPGTNVAPDDGAFGRALRAAHPDRDFAGPIKPGPALG